MTTTVTSAILEIEWPMNDRNREITMCIWITMVAWLGQLFQWCKRS